MIGEVRAILPPHVPAGHQPGAIRMFSGRCVDPFTMTADDVDSTDIVIGLSKLARYNGQSYFTYTVGQHSCLLHDWAVSAGHDANTALWFLLHDAPEIYISDIPRPVKRNVAIHAVISPLEARVMQCVAQKFGLEGPQPEVVDIMDHDIVYSEKKALQPYGYIDCGVYFPDGPKHEFLIEEWSAQRTTAEFAGRLLEHMGHRGVR